ncbi:predicted protein [Naegleria gruberi]|uniref:Predicted protein n=1 Tax=Naegleria gruberi TaxID=5762 RepID=D2VM37_NAEGR|nr:uncharacterized protein NAEGRDRAFT_69998 [Naegleria gruberi]EFC42251.1 predicted protein [Naegleria gruberi]|eukprot:XP_002674995.1 predicted protein [Naegleria gruberi strain NEG-M]
MNTLGGGFRFAQQPTQKVDWSKLSMIEKMQHLVKQIGGNLVQFHWALFPIFFLIGVNYTPYGHAPLSFSTKLYSLLAFLPLPIPMAPLDQLEQTFQMQQQAQQQQMGGYQM